MDFPGEWSLAGAFGATFTKKVARKEYVSSWIPAFAGMTKGK